MKNNLDEIVINKGFLVGGKDLVLNDKIIVKHPSIGEINTCLEGYSIYWQMANLLMCDPYDNMVMLDDMGINYQDVDCFEVFCYQWQSTIKTYEENKETFDKMKYNPLSNIKHALQFFLGEHNFDLQNLNVDEEQKLCLIDLDSVEKGTCHYFITGETYNYIANFISSINDIPKADRINPADETTRKMLIEDMRNEIKKSHRKNNKSNTYTIGDYFGEAILALSFGGNGGVSIFDMDKIKVYTLLKGYSITMGRINYDHTMNGVYAGTVDIKKLNKKELNWVK